MKWQTLRKEKVIQIIQKQLDKVYRLCYTVYRVKEGGGKMRESSLSHFKRIVGNVLPIHITFFAVSSDKKTMKENNSQYVYNNKKSGKKNFSIDAIKSLHPE